MKTNYFRLIALIALAPSAVWAVPPSVTLSPNTDHPKATDKVSGAGFGAYKAIDIYWDTTDIQLATTDGTGSFGPLKFKVPIDAPPGEHWVAAVQRGKGTAAQAPFNVSTAWAQRGFDARGKRDNPYENVISASNVDQLDVAWSYATNDLVESSPAVVNGMVYVGSYDGNLYALDAATGNLNWLYVTGGPIDYSSPAVANGIVYVGSADHNVYALDAVTGALKWTFPTGDIIESSPAVVNGIVYIGSYDHNVYALDAATGALIWSAATNGIVLSSPSVANSQAGDGIAFVGSGDHSVYAFNSTTGAKIWGAQTSASVYASPAVANGLVNIGSYDSGIYALSVANGTGGGLALGSALFASPAVADGVLYQGTTAGRLYAMQADGSFMTFWDYQQSDNFHSSPAVANGVVYFGSDSGEIRAVAAGKAGGYLLWGAKTGSLITSSPAVSDGMVYVGSFDHNIYAYALDGGKNAVYKHRHTQPPSIASLHPDFRLKVTR